MLLSISINKSIDLILTNILYITKKNTYQKHIATFFLLIELIGLQQGSHFLPRQKRLYLSSSKIGYSIIQIAQPVHLAEKKTQV